MKQAQEVCKALLLNIAACNLKAEDWQRATICCNQVLQWDIRNAKAYFRRGIASSKIGKLDDAMRDLQEALSFTENSNAATRQHIKREIETLTSQIQRKRGDSLN